MAVSTLSADVPVTAAPESRLRRVAFHALGTQCELQFDASDAIRAAQFERAALGWLQAFEARYSRFQPDSLVSRINAAAGAEWIAIDQETERLFDLCDMMYALTQGIMDPTLLPLIRLWNYKAEQPAIPSDGAIAVARQRVGWPKVRRQPGSVFLPQEGMALDFGGFGKEYAVDVVAQIALEYGIEHVLVDFGHDLRALGRPPGRPAWHIGLEDPRQPGTSSGSIALTQNRGVACSGDYLRRFIVGGRRYGHILDPRTGHPVANGCLQATVIAGTCLHAGLLSTTAFILGERRGIEFIQSFPGAEGLIVSESARAQTRGFFNHVVS